MSQWILLLALSTLMLPRLAAQEGQFDHYWAVIGSGVASPPVNPDNSPDLITSALMLLKPSRADTSELLGSLSRLARRQSGEPAAWAFYASAVVRSRAAGHCYPIDAITFHAFQFGCRQVFAELRDALKVDSSFAPAILALDDAAPYPLIWEEPSRVVGRVSAALQRTIPDSARRRLLRLKTLLAAEVLESPDSLRQLIESAGPVLTDGERNYLLAESAALASDPGASMSWYAAAAGSGDSGIALPWIARDISLVGREEESQEWNAIVSPGERSQWASRFWSDRDRRNGQPEGHRIVEHFVRWRTALSRYRSFAGSEITNFPPSRALANLSDCVQRGAIEPDTYADQISFITPDGRYPLLDDRGMIYMRHGPPTREANYPGATWDDYQGWLYAQPDAPRFVFFCRPMAINRSYAVGFAAGDKMAACEVLAAYCVFAARQSMGRVPPEQIERLRERGTNSVAQLLKSDADYRSFPKELAASVQIFGRGLSEQGVLIVADIPFESLRNISLTGGSPAIRWEVLAWGPSGEQVLSINQVQTLPAPTSGIKDGFVTSVIDLPSNVPMADVLVVLSDSAGQFGRSYQRSAVPVGPPVGNRSVSDLLLFVPGTGGRSRAWGDSVVTISPALASGSRKRLAVGYELTGFHDQNVTLTLAIRETASGSSKPVLSIILPHNSSELVARRVWDIDIGQLDPDHYQVSLTVQTADGFEVTRTQPFRVP